MNILQLMQQGIARQQAQQQQGWWRNQQQGPNTNQYPEFDQFMNKFKSRNPSFESMFSAGPLSSVFGNAQNMMKRKQEQSNLQNTFSRSPIFGRFFKSFGEQ